MPSLMSNNSRSVLFATVSVVALAVASTQVRAADLPVAAKPPVVKAPAARSETTWFVEGAGFSTAGDPAYLFLGPTPFKPKFGWEGAIGFDYRFPPQSPAWHVSAQFRYGQASRDRELSGIFTVPGYPSVNIYTGEAKHKERHWVADFAVGRDNGIGTNQIKLGIRVAEVGAKTDFDGLVYGTSPIYADQRSKFLGVGPRLGAEGSTPLQGAWSLDLMAGVAVLYGRRELQVSYLDTYNNEAFSSKFADHAWVLNVDASAGLTYAFTPNFKITTGYRFDGYWNALKTYNAAGAIVNVDRLYHGPFVRATGRY